MRLWPKSKARHCALRAAGRLPAHPVTLPKVLCVMSAAFGSFGWHCHCLCLCHCWNSTNKIFASRQHIYATLSRICKYQFSNMENQSQVRCLARSLWSNKLGFVYMLYKWIYKYINCICNAHILKLFRVELFWLLAKYYAIYCLIWHSISPEASGNNS